VCGSSVLATIDPLFDDDGAAMVALARRALRYRTYSSHEKVESAIGDGLLQRHDSVVNFLRTGGRHGRTDLEGMQLLARTSYFREEYAYDGASIAEGIGPFLHHDRLLAGARSVHGRPVIEPSIAYANIMLPGQELAVHTDVPEFRGLNRKRVPQWLLVVMHHSGLFDASRLPIATGISWFSGGVGGELSTWPTGARRRVRCPCGPTEHGDRARHRHGVPRCRPGGRADHRATARHRRRRAPAPRRRRRTVAAGRHHFRRGASDI